MLVNYQTNYRQPSFERFRFNDNAKKVVLNKINTPAKFKKFKELCEQEETGDRASRNIDIFFVRYFTDRLFTEIGHKEYMQGIFQSTNSSLLNRFGRFLPPKKTKKLEVSAFDTSSEMVAGAGFEPTTFGL